MMDRPHRRQSTVSLSTPHDSLLYDLYGCCTNSAHWRPVLDKICAEIGAVAAVLQCVDVEGPRAIPFWTAHDSRMPMDAYISAVSDAHNPRFDCARLLTAAQGPALQGDLELFQADERPIRDRLQGQLLALGLGRFIGGLVKMGDHRYMALAVHRDPHDPGDFSTRERERLDGLLPHLAQALSLTRAVAQSRSASALLHGYLDRWLCALVVTDGRGQVHWMNRRATEQLRRAGELQVTHNALRASNTSAQQRLTQALQQVQATHSPDFFSMDAAEGPLQVVVQPVESPSAASDGLMLWSFTNDNMAGHIPAEAIKALFNLTETEARLACALVSGITVEQYAQHRGVTVGTARYQLNQVLVKTGAHRQADLVRRVLCSAAASLTQRHNGLATTH